jgi:hypothetical protein
MRVITPDIMFLVETPSVAAKQKWIGAADRAIAKHLTKRGIEFDGMSYVSALNVLELIEASLPNRLQRHRW